MNTIVAATDYSSLAENAVEYAAAIARQKKERLILLNDIEEPVHAENARLSEGRFQQFLDENEARLLEKAAVLAKKYGITVLAKSTNSIVENEISNLIAEYHVYMVVMGMEARSRYQELWGNTTTSVIKHLPINVLAVPAKAKFENVSKVLFACDALHGVSEQLLERIKNIALTNPVEIEILIISTGPKNAATSGEMTYSLKVIDERLKGIAYHYENVNADSIVDGIRKEVIRSKAGVLIMAPEKHGFWDSLIHRSATRAMASGLDIPLLSVPL